MRTKLKEKYENEANYGAGVGTKEEYIYECPCDKGKIIEKHCNVPDFRGHDISIMCEECNKIWTIKSEESTWKEKNFYLLFI